MSLEKPYLKTIDEIFSLAKTSRKGLSTAEATERLKVYGPNQPRKVSRDSIPKILLRQFNTLIVWVLLAAAGISYYTGHNLEFVVIIGIVMFVVLLGAIEENKAARDMRALTALTPKTSTVIRDGKVTEVNSSELTIGDILVLRRGCVVGADARIFEANTLMADESPLTGESHPVLKFSDALKEDLGLSEQRNMAFAGTSIVNGDGLAVVVAVGEESEIGNVSRLVSGLIQEKTPLQKRLEHLTRQLSIGVICIAVVIFSMLLSREGLSKWDSALIFSMAVIVSGIPESLPAVVSITLAAGVKRMAKRNAIVKRLTAVETLGTCTVICSDKTGTLTQNRMVIEHIFTSDAEINVTGEGYSPDGIFLMENKKIDPRAHKTVSKILEIGVLCNNAELKEAQKGWEIEGESTEGALVVLARKAGIVKWEFSKEFPRAKEHPFDPERKLMSTVHIYQGKHIVYTKGAPESLIKKAKHYLHEGKILPMNERVYNTFMQKNKEYASKGLRVLGLAFKEHRGSLELHNVESELVFVGLVSIRDPPDPNVKDSIQRCQSAGIKVVMITGDNDLTAKSIAQELGIFSEGDLLLTGEELEKLKEAEFERIVEHVSVYARVTPAQKLRIVTALQKRGHIVAMTGDGVNDAPALKRADIGIAMGLRGTEVAKESAELILKDDNFTTIANAVEDGRTIYENIRKFVYYLLAGNFSEVSIMLVSVIAAVATGNPTITPITALMILFVNLVTSDFPAIGLAFEPASPRIMRQKPRNPKEGILSEYLLLKIVHVIPLIVLGVLLLFIWQFVLKQAPLEKAQTVAMATIICFELFHVFNAKSWDGSVFSRQLLSNKALWAGVGISVICTILVVHWAPAQMVFGTVGLSFTEWLSVICVSCSILLWVELHKTMMKLEIMESEALNPHPTRVLENT